MLGSGSVVFVLQSMPGECAELLDVQPYCEVLNLVQTTQIMPSEERVFLSRELQFFLQ